MTRIDMLAESIEEETGLPPVEADSKELTDASFRPFISSLERFDSEDFIYIRENAKYYKVPKSYRIQIYLMGLRYLHDFQT